MARFSVAFRSAGAGSNILPLGSLWATTAVRPRVVEIGVFNTTATQVAVAVVRLSTGTGTKGSAVTPVFEDDNSQGAVSGAANTHTAQGTMVLGVPLRQATLGAAYGSGVIWTFGGGKTPGLIVPNTANDGIGVIIPTGTGQVCDLSFTWDE